MSSPLDPRPDPHWRLLGEEAVHEAGIFELWRDLYEHRGTVAGHPFYRLQARDWVNVVAVTGGREVVLVRQYRHGTREVTLEVPGGVVDPGESPADAAARELLEETGFAGDAVVPLGAVTSNPAFLNNRTHSFLVPNAARVQEQNLDEHEDIEVLLAPVSEVPALLSEGRIHHALAACALFHYWLQHGSPAGS